MRARKFAELAFRLVLLFVLSMIMMVAFWYHREFYRLGLWQLMLLGGGVIFVFLLFIWLLVAAPAIFKTASEGLMELDYKEAALLLDGVKTVVVCAQADLIPSGIDAFWDVSVRGGRKISTQFRVRDIYRKLLGDISIDEIKLAGNNSIDEFKAQWTKKYDGWNPDEIVHVVSLEPA